MAYIYEIIFGLRNKYRFKNCFPTAEPLLIHAVHDSNVDVVKMILNQGTSPDETCQHGITPLYVAIQNNYKECTDILVKYGANINAHLFAIDADDNEVDMTPLILASCLNNSEIVQILLNANVSVNDKAHNGMNALMFAIANRCYDCIDTLIQNGACVNDTNQQDTSPLMIAAKHGDTKIIETLLSKGAIVNHVNMQGNSPLVLSVLQGNEESVELLIKAGADTNICNSNNSNLLIEAQYYNAPPQKVRRLVTLLVEGGCNVNAENDGGETPLFPAIDHRDTETIKYLLQAGSDVNQETLLSISPLSYAATEASVCEVDLLLKAGSDPNIGHPLTAIAHPDILAQLPAKQLIAKSLITAGANINNVDPEFGTALVIASFIGSTDLVMTALNAKAKINIAKIYPTDIVRMPNSHTLSMLLAAGELCSEIFTKNKYPDVNNFVANVQNDTKLKNYCRKTIREHLIKTGQNMNLLVLISKLPLPAILTSYLQYDMF